MISRLIETRKTIITCGTGGVGKTTLSAAIALKAALAGKKTLVITIDPAKRLATSLGIQGLGHAPEDLTEHIRAFAPQITGSLEALMPDTRKTFETFVQSLAPDRSTAKRVTQNPIFQIFAKEFSGTNEYMALERLHQMRASGHYDLIILDTPPSRNTLAFLDAPQLLARFFDEKLIRWLVVPTQSLMAMGMKKALGILEKLTGAGFMTNLLEFAQALFEVRSKFLKNLGEITQFLKSDSVGFILIASASAKNIPEMKHFIDRLQNHQFRFDGIILNRLLGALPSGKPDQPSDELKAALEILDALQKQEKVSVQQIYQELNPLTPAWNQLPELARDVHSIEDLYHVANLLDSQFNTPLLGNAPSSPL